MEELLRRWDGEEVIIRLDRPTGSWIVVAIHSTRLGPATGGTRMKHYPDLESAVADACNLARGMTYKFAVTDFPRGGGKAVIALQSDISPAARSHLLRRYGALIHQLGGLYLTGPDVGTSPVDMDIIAETGAPYVHSRTPAAGGAGDSGPPTASGVFHGIKAVCEHLFGSNSLAGRRILVQGAGSVGGRLISMLVAARAEVLFTDVNMQRVYTTELPAEAVFIKSGEEYATECDIFSPCALGGILNARTIPMLRCRAVAGSANNQLETDEDAERLRDRGILYAPDVVISMGGALAITGMEGFGWSSARAESEVMKAIVETLRRVFALSESGGITTLAAARRIADERLEGFADRGS